VREAFLEVYTPPPQEYFEALVRQARAELDAELTMEDKAKYSAVLIMRMARRRFSATSRSRAQLISS